MNGLRLALVVSRGHVANYKYGRQVRQASTAGKYGRQVRQESTKNYETNKKITVTSKDQGGKRGGHEQAQQGGHTHTHATHTHAHKQGHKQGHGQGGDLVPYAPT